MKAIIRRRIEDLKGAFERLSQRERTMVLSLAGALLFCVFLATGYLLMSELQEMEDENEQTRLALRELERLKDQYIAERQRQLRIEARMSPEPLELNSYVEKAASEVGVKIDEASEVNPLNVGSVVQRGLEIKVRHVSLSQLVVLLEKLEESRTHVVQVTRLDVNTRWKKNNELDVSMIVSTFEKAAEAEESKREESHEVAQQPVANQNRLLFLCRGDVPDVLLCDVSLRQIAGCSRE